MNIQKEKKLFKVKITIVETRVEEIERLELSEEFIAKQIEDSFNNNYSEDYTDKRGKIISKKFDYEINEIK